MAQALVFLSFPTILMSSPCKEVLWDFGTPGGAWTVKVGKVLDSAVFFRCCRGKPQMCMPASTGGRFISMPFEFLINWLCVLCLPSWAGASFVLPPTPCTSCLPGCFHLWLTYNPVHKCHGHVLYYITRVLSRAASWVLSSAAQWHHQGSRFLSLFYFVIFYESVFFSGLLDSLWSGTTDIHLKSNIYCCPGSRVRTLFSLKYFIGQSWSPTNSPQVQHTGICPIVTDFSKLRQELG